MFYKLINKMMKSINIKLQNCFGIGQLEHTFDFSKSNTYLIYAPNGTMKTSFSKTLDLISKANPKEKPCDQIYVEEVSVYEVLNDGIELPHEQILVINADDQSYDATTKISTFLASQELKDQYDAIYQRLELQKKDFIKKLVQVSKSTDCEKEIERAFFTDEVQNIFDVLSNLQADLNSDLEEPKFRYNDIFDTTGKVEKFISKNKRSLNEYMSCYNQLMGQSDFFKNTHKNAFGTYQANQIIKSTEDNSFFDAGHRFVLGNNQEVANVDDLKSLIQEEILKISENGELKDIFNKIDKEITANKELREFHSVIEKDNTILTQLTNYELFKKQTWIAFISQLKIDADNLIALYKTNQSELNRIISEAAQELDVWKKILTTYNNRFLVPFSVEIQNQSDVLLKREMATLAFCYAENGKEPISKEKDELLKVLSRGEQRAFFILQFLFELESRRRDNQQHLLILDDIADSFDYKNKFAIIEYIKELHEEGKFKIIILTHNFDFYRTVASRLGLSRTSVYMAVKNDQRLISLQKGEYQKDVFTHLLGKVSDIKTFISLITFMRNIAEYMEDSSSTQYLQLTSCLHVKPDSNTLSAQNIFDIFQNIIPKLSQQTISFGTENIIDIIYKNADDLSQEASINEILLENKISLAIAIRLKAEQYMIRKLRALGIVIEDISRINSNQTQVLYREYKSKFTSEYETLKILDQVNLMTPENIHINAFMYEPLIDMSVYHLITLYKTISAL